MFIEPDEYLIIMDMDSNVPNSALTQDELYAVRDAGVRTVYRQAAIRWDIMQPYPAVPFDWSRLDAFVERAMRAGLKMLIPFIYSLPPWKPDEYFFSRERVEICYGVPNYENPAVAEELDGMIAETIGRYSGDDCQIVYSIPCNGELAFHIWTRDNEFYCPEDVLVNWVVERQKLFEAQHGEIWTAYHPFSDPKYWGPIYDALFSTFPYSKHYGFMFTYVQRYERHFFERIRENQERGMIYYAGTEYVQGMRANVPRLLTGNMRMLTAPKHPLQGGLNAVGDWEKGEIEWALEQYETDWIRV